MYEKYTHCAGMLAIGDNAVIMYCPCVFGQVSFHYTVKHTRHACASNRALIHSRSAYFKVLGCITVFPLLLFIKALMRTSSSLKSKGFTK